MSMQFAAQNYFSTKLKTFGAGRRQTGGYWNFTHSSVIDPNYMGKGWFKRETGLTWWQVKRLISNEFMNTINDPGIINQVKQTTAPFIPVRSGRLMEKIFSSMKIVRTQKRLTDFWATLTYSWSKYRPYPIKGRTTHNSELGYGEWGSVKLTEPLVINRVKIHHVTAGGNALYYLDDPAAVPDPTSTINDVASKLIMQDLAEKFNFVLEAVL